MEEERDKGEEERLGGNEEKGEGRGKVGSEGDVVDDVEGGRRGKSEEGEKSEEREREREGQEVYCFCRKPQRQNEFMIACDRCNEWFHGACLGKNTGVWKREREILRDRETERKTGILTSHEYFAS
jgi:hypothetical protein